MASFVLPLINLTLIFPENMSVLDNEVDGKVELSSEKLLKKKSINGYLSPEGKKHFIP